MVKPYGISTMDNLCQYASVYSALSIHQNTNSYILNNFLLEYVPFWIHKHISAIFSHGIWTTAVFFFPFFFWVGRWPTCHIWSVFHFILMIIMVTICNMTNMLQNQNVTEYNVHHEYWIIMYVQIFMSIAIYFIWTVNW